MTTLLSILMLATTPALAHDGGNYSYETTLDFTASDWMAALPDDRKLSELSLVMTHDSMTYSLDDGGRWGASAVTQRMSLLEQLDSGVRGLDIRLKWDIVRQEFLVYHGSSATGHTLDQVLDATEAFLVAHPGETVLMSIKQEWGSQDDAIFCYELHRALVADSWPLLGDDTNNPVLGDMRGKIVISRFFERFDGNVPFGVDFTEFDSSTAWEFNDTASGISSKVSNIEAHLDKADAGDADTVYFTGMTIASLFSKPYFAASGHDNTWTHGDHRRFGTWQEDWVYPAFPRENCFTNPWGTHVCDVNFAGINDLTADHIETNGLSHIGIVNMDFPGADFLAHVIKMNEPAPEVQQPLGADDGLVFQRNDGLMFHVGIDNGAELGATFISAPGTEWTPEDPGDLNGDGTDDIVWRHDNGQVAFQAMSNGVPTSFIHISTPVSSDWNIQGVGDVDGDGTDDIVWRHDNGQVHYWSMSNGTRTGGFHIYTPVTSDWTVRGVGDMDGDGTDDIVWQHSGGQVHYWTMSNGAHTGGVNVFTPVSADVGLYAVGDVDGNGSDDIIWQFSDGQVHYWPMVNGQRAGGLNIGAPWPAHVWLVGAGNIH